MIPCKWGGAYGRIVPLSTAIDDAAGSYIPKSPDCGRIFGDFNLQAPFVIPSATMHKTGVGQLTTVELIDALEAGIAAIRSRNGDPIASSVSSIGPAELRAELERSVASGGTSIEPAALRAELERSVASGDTSIEPAALRAEMERHAVSAIELARATGIPCDEVDAWMGGGSAIPHWALMVIRLVAQLAPAARRKVLAGPRREYRTPRERIHPFSRIEDL